MKLVSSMLRTAMISFEHGSRRSGRTLQMIAAVNDGDTIIFSNQREAQRVARLLCEMEKKKVNCVVAPYLHEVAEKLRRCNNGRVHFDHGWFYDYWMRAVEDEQKVLDRFIAEFNKPYQKPERIRGILDGIGSEFT